MVNSLITFSSENVPNAPCGVESCTLIRATGVQRKVPNAPCGVERLAWKGTYWRRWKFLMHRVELKVNSSISLSKTSILSS